MIEKIENNDNLYLIYELCEGGNLESALLYHGNYSEKETIEILKQLLNGFKTLE